MIGLRCLSSSRRSTIPCVFCILAIHSANMSTNIFILSNRICVWPWLVKDKALNSSDSFFESENGPVFASSTITTCYSNMSTPYLKPCRVEKCGRQGRWNIKLTLSISTLLHQFTTLRNNRAATLATLQFSLTRTNHFLNYSDGYHCEN